MKKADEASLQLFFYLVCVGDWKLMASDILSLTNEDCSLKEFLEGQQEFSLFSSFVDTYS